MTYSEARMLIGTCFATDYAGRIDRAVSCYSRYDIKILDVTYLERSCPSRTTHTLDAGTFYLCLEA